MKRGKQSWKNTVASDKLRPFMGGFFLLTALFFSLSGCFNVREVEPPQTSSDWISPTDYSILLDNFERAVSQKNSQNYLRCLPAQGFKFKPSTSVLAQDNQSIFVNWSVIDEQTWLENVVADLGVVTGNSLEVKEVNLLEVTPDSVKFVGTYNLFMQHSDTSMTTRFLGQVEFVFKINGFNEWEIHRWTDYESHPDSSWSLLKLHYAQ
ncbi:MAG: hypothetical protein H6581_11180 [Bacteroidia bacterium]|nr:hypothetical protein [Bacteroidia bacterium]